MSFYYTHVDKKSKLFSSKINDKTGIVTILTRIWHILGGVNMKQVAYMQLSFPAAVQTAK